MKDLKEIIEREINLKEIIESYGQNFIIKNQTEEFYIASISFGCLEVEFSEEIIM